jgi:hypothetical protein
MTTRTALFFAMVGVSLFSACGTSVARPTTSTDSVVELSLDARKAAAVEAATRYFQQTVKDTFLTAQGMTVRGLVRAASQKVKQVDPKSPAALNPAAFDPNAGTAAKLELTQGHVRYTLVASARDDAAAVIERGGARYTVSYEVEARVTPDGELSDVVVHQVGEPTRAN